MVPQVLPNPRQFVLHRNPHFAQVSLRPYTRQEQQLRRSDRPAAGNHQVCPDRKDLVPALYLHARSPLAFKQDPADGNAGAHRQVQPVPHRVQVR